MVQHIRSDGRQRRRAVPYRRFVVADPHHLRCTVRRIGHQTRPLGEQVLPDRGDQSIALFGGALVQPDDRRAQRLTVGVACDDAIYLTSQAHRHDPRLFDVDDGNVALRTGGDDVIVRGRRCARRSSGWTNADRAVRSARRRGRGGPARRADRSGGRCIAQCTEDDVDPGTRADASGAAATLAPVGSYVLHHLAARAGRRERVVHDGVRRHPPATSTPHCAGRPTWTRPCSRRSAVTEVVGTLRPAIAAEFGLLLRVARLSSEPEEADTQHRRGRRAAVEAGVVVDVTGTAEPVTTVSAAPMRDPLRLVGDARPCRARLMADRESRIQKRALARRAVGVPQAEVFPLALAPPASEGVLFLPALSGATAPRWNEAVGGLLGLAE